MAEASVEVALTSGDSNPRVAVLNGRGSSRGTTPLTTIQSGKDERCGGWQLNSGLLVFLVSVLIVQSTLLAFFFVERLRGDTSNNNIPREGVLEETVVTPVPRGDWGGAPVNGSQPADSWSPLLLQPRCFSMCESADLFYRQGGLCHGARQGPEGCSILIKMKIKFSSGKFRVEQLQSHI
jgi:hypothetical protein